MQRRPKQPPTEEAKKNLLPRPPRNVYTKAETEQQIIFLEELLSNPQVYSDTQRRQLMKQRFQIGMTRYKKVYFLLQERWKQRDTEQDRDAKRRAQIARLHKELAWASGRRDPQDPTKWIEKPDFAAIRSFEALLAELEGTREPIKVDIDVRMTTSVVNVMANLSPEQVAELVAEQDERERLANERREQLKLLEQGTTIDVTKASATGGRQGMNGTH